MHPLPIISKVFSFEPLSPRGSPVTQKYANISVMLRTWDQRQSHYFKTKIKYQKIAENIFIKILR